MYPMTIDAENNAKKLTHFFITLWFEKKNIDFICNSSRPTALQLHKKNIIKKIYKPECLLNSSQHDRHHKTRKHQYCHHQAAADLHYYKTIKRKIIIINIVMIFIIVRVHTFFCTNFKSIKTHVTIYELLTLNVRSIVRPSKRSIDRMSVRPKKTNLMTTQFTSTPPLGFVMLVVGFSFLSCWAKNTNKVKCICSCCKCWFCRKSCQHLYNHHLHRSLFLFQLRSFLCSFCILWYQ